MAGQPNTCWGNVQQVDSSADQSDGSVRGSPVSDCGRASGSTAARVDKTSPGDDDAEPVMDSMKVDPLDLSTCNSQTGSSKATGTTARHQEEPSVKIQGIPQGYFVNKDCDTMDQTRSGRSSTTGPQQQSSAATASGSTEEAHKCDMCGKTFAVPARLTRHYRTHTGERPFVCEVCGKSFSVKENLSVHRRIHTKEKPYRCPHCGRGFEHSGKLHRHMRIHTGERPHQCSDCGKTFIQSGQLVIHMRSHTGEKPYVCTVCGKGFTCSKQLKVHSRTHTGERPYACEVCGKTFAYNHVLKLHQMAHLGERLYKCTLCSETYSSKKALETHIKLHALSSSTSATAAVATPATAQPASSTLSSTVGTNHPYHAALHDGTMSAKLAPHSTHRLPSSASQQKGAVMESMSFNSRSPPSSIESNRSSPSDLDVYPPSGPSAVFTNGVASVVESLRPLHSKDQPVWNALSVQRAQKKTDEPQQSTNTNFIYPRLPNLGWQRNTMDDPTLGGKSWRYDNDPHSPQQKPKNGSVHSNGTSCNNQDQATSAPAYLRPMPPLIPVTSISAAHNYLHVPQKKQQRLIQAPSAPSPLSPLQLALDAQATSSRGPPRKSSRFREGGGEGSGDSDHSPTSSASSSPPLATTDGDTSMRATSVIRFAHRPGSSSSSPLPSSSQ